MSKTFKWIDLSAYGLKMMASRNEKNELYFLVTDISNETVVNLSRGVGQGNVHWDLRELGFIYDEQKRFYVRFGTDFKLAKTPPSPQEIIKVMKKATLIDADPKDYFYIPKVEQKLTIDWGNVKYVGMNRRGVTVNEIDGKRFYMSGENPVFETPETRSMFLRVYDDASLAAATEGFLKSILTQVTHKQNFEDFVTAIYGNSDEYHMRLAFNSLQQSISRELRKESEPYEAFQKAVKISEHSRFLGAIPGLVGDTDIVGAPLGVALGRLAVGETTLINSGNGVLLSGVGKGAITIYEENAESVNDIQNLVKSTGGSPDQVKVGSGTNAYKGNVIKNISKSSLGERTDFAEALQVFENTEKGKFATVILRVDISDKDAFEEFARKAHDKFGLSTIAEINSSLLYGLPGEARTYVMIAGKTPMVEFDIKKIEDFNALWMWSARQANSTYVAPKTDDENAYQVPYVSTSKTRDASTMVPKYLEAATRDSLARFENIDVDQYFADTYHYNKDEIAEYFSPEQIDACSLIQNAYERGRGFLTADKMGTGKGRQVAAVVRKAVMENKVTLLFTEKAINIPDQFRDIRDTGSSDIIKPLILNNGVKMIDPETGEEVLISQDFRIAEGVAATLAWSGCGPITCHTLSKEAKKRLMDRAKAENWGTPLHPDDAAELGRGKKARRNEVPLWIRQGRFYTRDGGPAVPHMEHLEPGDIVDTFTFTPDFNVVLGTVSQVNKNRYDSYKTNWLLSIPDIVATNNLDIKEDVKVVVDEIHNLAASKTSSIAKNFSKLFSYLPKNAILGASATWLHKAENIDIYNFVLPAIPGIKSGSLGDALKRGGPGFGELLSTMLVKDGVMIRREQDFSSSEFTHIRDTVNFERNSAMMDALAPILAEMAYFTGDAEKVLNAINMKQEAELAKKETSLKLRPIRNAPAPVPAENAPGIQVNDPEEGDGVRGPQNRVKKMGVSKMGFGSPLYDISRVFLASLLVDSVVDDAVETLKRGEKPIILLENTLETVLKDSLENGETTGPTLATFIKRKFDQICTVRRNGDRVHITELEPTMVEDYNRIVQAIMELPDWPVSNIDRVREGIIKKGSAALGREITCDELTGRKLCVKDGIITNRTVLSKVQVKNKFNNGELDALIINSTGTTGIDLHAGRRMKDQRKRRLIILEFLSNVLKQEQAYGRVIRFDQVLGATIANHIAGFPFEVRLLAMANEKLRKLSANVSANRDTNTIISDVPDILNALGDIVCSRYAAVRPDLVKRMGLKVEDKEATEDEIDDENKRTANALLARLSMLRVAEQQQIIDEITSEYIATLQEMEARGENPLKSREMTDDVQFGETTLFQGGGDDSASTVFDGDVYAQDIIITKKLPPLRSNSVETAVERGRGLNSGVNMVSYLKNVERTAQRAIMALLPPGCQTVEQAIEEKDTLVTREKARFDKMIDTLGNIQSGSLIKFTFMTMPEQAVVTGVHFPKSGNEHIASQYQIDLAVPGESNLMQISLSALLADPEFAVTDKYGIDGANGDDILENFDKSADKKKKYATKILKGNIFKAMMIAAKYKLGNMMNYIDENGNRAKGIFLTGAGLDYIHAVPFSIGNKEIIKEMLTYNNMVINTNLTDRFGVILTKSMNANNSVTLTIDKKNAVVGAGIDALITDMNVLGRESGKTVKIDIPASEFNERMQKYGINEFTMHRDGRAGNAHKYSVNEVYQMATEAVNKRHTTSVSTAPKA